MDSDNNKRKFEDSEDFGLEKKKKATDKPDEVLPNITVAMECPVEKVGAVIGKKGANVNEIMKRSGCKIAIDQSDHRDGAPRKINLTGPPDKLAVAMQLVSKLMKDGANALLEGGAKATSEEKGSANSEKSATLGNRNDICDRNYTWQCTYNADSDSCFKICKDAHIIDLDYCDSSIDDTYKDDKRKINNNDNITNDNNTNDNITTTTISTAITPTPTTI